MSARCWSGNTMQKRLKPKPCKVCRTVFQPRPMQSVCGPDCAREFARDKRERDDRKKQREEGRQTRARLEELKTLPQLHKEAQKEFNRYVRLRDAGLPCICCDERLTDTNLTGGGWDCGHYRSVGSAGHLRHHPAGRRVGVRPQPLRSSLGDRATQAVTCRSAGTRPK